VNQPWHDEQVLDEYYCISVQKVETQKGPKKIKKKKKKKKKKGWGGDRVG